MKRSLKLFTALLFCVLFVGASGMHALACTAVYVGRDVSEDGTILLAKSNDYQDVWANYVTITERVENKPGRTMPVDNGATVFAPLPDTTYRYTSTPWMDSAIALNGLGKDATVCANECGVSMIMSITSFSAENGSITPPLLRRANRNFFICPTARKLTTAGEYIQT